MTLAHGASIVTDGLTMLVDAANPRSYPGSGAAWNDLSGYSNNATLVGGITYSGINNGLLTFNGSTGYFTGTTNANLTLTSDFTIEMWIKCGTQSQLYPVLLGKNVSWTSGAVTYICVSHSGAPNVIALYNYNVGNPFLTGSIIVTNSIWHQILISRISGTVTLYVDTVVDNIYSNSTTWDYSNFVIGSNPSDGGTMLANLAYGGAMSSLKIYNGIGLTQLQIQQNFNAYRGRYGI